MSDGPALAMVEISDLPSGLLALDALVKEAPVEVVSAGTVQHGHWLLAFAGEVYPVELSFKRALECAGTWVVDAVLLADAEPRILATLQSGSVRASSGSEGDSVGVVQTSSSPTLLRALDAALKGANVELLELRAAEGLGGRALAMLWGHQTDVEAAIDHASRAFAKGRPEGCSTTIIPNADREVGRALRSGSRFFKEFRG